MGKQSTPGQEYKQGGNAGGGIGTAIGTTIGTGLGGPIGAGIGGWLGNAAGNAIGGLFGGGGGQPSTPSSQPAQAVSPYQQAAEAQAASSSQAVNRQTQANRPDIFTPFGSMQWEQGPNGEWTLRQGLSPQVQSAYEGMQPFSFGQFGQMGTGDTARQQAIDAAYTQATSRLNPQFAQSDEALQARLANQGIDPNSAAGRAALAQQSQARNDAYGSAMNSAIMQGQAAGDSVFKNNMMARQQAISEALKQRGMPLEDLAGLQQFTQMPSFMGAGLREPVQYLQALGGANQMEQQGQANQADFFGGLAKLGISAMPFLL